MQGQFLISEFQISSFAIEHRELITIDENIETTPYNLRPFRCMQVPEMIDQFNIETNDDEYAKPEDVFDNKARKIEKIKDAGYDELGD